MKKVLIIVGVVIVVCILGAAAVAYIAVSWTRGVMEQGQKSIAEAEEFGRQATDAQCLERVIAKAEACEDEMCELMQIPFIGNCLHQATPTSGFCAGVPAPNTASTAPWVERRCLAVSTEKRTCQAVYHVVQAHCADR
jgi:hypothetical protein